MYCPRDHTDLLPKKYKQHQVHHCPSCKGLWLPKDIVPSLLSSSVNGRIRILQHTRDSPLTCPNQCAGLLEMKVNGILIDVCPTCDGVWLDRGEIKAVLKKTTALRNGKKSEPDSVVVSVLDGASLCLPDLLEALVGGLLDGI